MMLTVNLIFSIIALIIIKNSFLRHTEFSLLTIMLQLIVFSLVILTNSDINIAVLLFVIAAIDTAIGLSLLIKYHNLTNKHGLSSDAFFLILIHYFYIILLTLVFICKVSNSLFMPHLLLEIKPLANTDILKTIIEPTLETVNLDNENSYYPLLNKILRISCAIFLVGYIILPGLADLYFPIANPEAIMYYFFEIQRKLSTGSFLEQLFWVEDVINDSYRRSSIDNAILNEILNWANSNLEVCQDPVYMEHLTYILELIKNLLQ